MMDMDNYVCSYLDDAIGMRPREAAAYLRNSLVGRYLRSFRIQVDRDYNPRTECLASPMDDYTEGRVTFKVDRAGTQLKITHVYAEFDGQILKGIKKAPKPSIEIFTLGKVLPEGYRYEPMKVIPSSTPVRGWHLIGIESLHITNDSTVAVGRRILPPPPEVKTPVRPHFIDVVAPLGMLQGFT